jgi:signal transduction histidine kinase
MAQALVSRRDGESVPAPAAERRFPREFLLYVALLTTLVAVAVPGGLLAFADYERDALILLALMVAASLLTVSVDPDQNVDWQLDGPVAVAAAVLLPPPLAVLVAFCGFTNRRELHLATSPWLSLFNRGQIAVSVAIAAIAAASLTGGERDQLRLVLATTLAIVIHNGAGYVLWWVGHALLHRGDGGGRPVIPRFPVHMLLVSGLALPIVVIYAVMGQLAVVLLMVPLALGYSAIRSARESEERASELALQVRELETLNGLGKQLLATDDLTQVVATTADALRAALGTDDVLVDLAGGVPARLEVYKVPGAEPAAIGVPPGLSDGSVAAVEAVAGLLGMSLQRVELSEKLSEVQRARVELSGQIIEEGTRERSRIALDIHDDVLPYFAAAEIQADNVRTSLRRDQIGRAEELAGITQDAIHDGIGRLRDVLAQLRRQIIVPGSLQQGLQEALDTLKLEHGVEGALVFPDQRPSLPLAVEILIVETVRGCLANVARHAQADWVTVVLGTTHSGISVTICDDGRGFDPTAVREGSHGLSLMAQRVDLARGHFSVTSALGEGTRVHLEVPL